MFPHNSTWNTIGRLSQRMGTVSPLIGDNLGNAKSREIYPSSEQGLLKLKATKTYKMASEESAKRLLRLAGCFKDTREPRGPEHMAKMKAARGPYSDRR